MRTELAKLLGIQYPVIQGGMAWVAEYHLAAAVSEAGGLGIIGAANAPAEWVREQIHKTRELTEKPFGVNVMLMSPYAEQVAQVVAEEEVPVVTTGAGSPEKYMELWKSKSIKVIPVVASVALAKRMERCGADALVAEGCESGGHIGESTTMTLVPQVVDAAGVPVIAAGGIADGRGIAAAFMLGASGVQMGTRFVATKECQVHETVDSYMTKKYLELESKGATLEELEYLTLGALRKAVQEGDMKNGSVMSGQIAGLVKEELTCKELMERLVKETDEILTGAKNYA